MNLNISSAATLINIFFLKQKQQKKTNMRKYVETASVSVAARAQKSI